MRERKIVFKGQTKRGKIIHVRYPQKEDTGELWRYINVLSKEQTFIRVQGEEIAFEEEKTYLQKLLDHISHKHAVHLLVFHDTTLVGTGGITMQERVESHVGVFGITIAKDYRGEGIGRMLMQIVLDEAEKELEHLKIVTLGVFGNNSGAISLYKNFGFIQYGILPQGVYYKGEYIDHIYMYKILRK